VVLTAALAVTLPSPAAPLPTSPAGVVGALRADDSALAMAIGRWSKTTPPPRDVVLLALHRQRLVRSVASRPTLARSVEHLLPAAKDDVVARMELTRLAAATPPLRSRVHLGPAASAAHLLTWYREAEARFGIRWQVLAAINFVESAFGRVRNTSSAGAQGPMQFEPATWRAYGLGGDVHRPRDAILGAANYLAANGGAHRERDALLHYNHSTPYVDAIERYAHRMAHTHDAFFEYYSWQVYVRTATGYRRVTGPRS
jgi:soluble lytic murein transglycosylase-like protein